MFVTGSTGSLERPGVGAVHDPKVVAREFASLFNSMLVRSMRGTVPDGGLIPTGMGEKIYTDMLDDEYANLLTDQGSMGLSELILKQIQNDQSSSSALRELKGLSHASRLHDSRLTPRGRSDSFDALAARVARWDGIIAEAGSRYNVDTNLIRAVVAQESAGDPYAVSRAGAKGLMQLMDPTAREMGVLSPFNPRENIEGGVRYLQAMLGRFHGDMSLALASYNAGPAAVERHKGIPPYAETQNYVHSVLRMRDRFADEHLNTGM